jgi:hypothetical protein
MTLTVYDVALYGFAILGAATVIATFLICWFAAYSMRAMDQDRR